jgi:hypothetical protein
VDITFATVNVEAGRLIGTWSARKLNGASATVALLDLFVDRDVSSDYGRDQGFRTGMGIPVADPTKNGDEEKTGNYSGGAYTIACNDQRRCPGARGGEQQGHHRVRRRRL